MPATTRTIPGFQALPDAGDPLGLLDACHDRMRRQLDTLERLLGRQRQADGPLVDEDVRLAARAIRRYFDEAAPRHHRDEEQDLFPAIIESMAGSDAVCLHAIVARLTAEHESLEQAWRALRPGLAALADEADGADAGDGAVAQARLDPEAAEGFLSACREHLALEDAELMPLAHRLLSDAQLAQISESMRARRDRGG